MWLDEMRRRSSANLNKAMRLDERFNLLNKMREAADEGKWHIELLYPLSPWLAHELTEDGFVVRQLDCGITIISWEK